MYGGEYLAYTKSATGRGGEIGEVDGLDGQTFLGRPLSCCQHPIARPWLTVERELSPSRRQHGAGLHTHPAAEVDCHPSGADSRCRQDVLAEETNGAGLLPAVVCGPVGVIADGGHGPDTDTRHPR